MLALLVDVWKILRLVCRYPLPLVLLQSAFGDQLQSAGVFVHGKIYPRTALVVLDDSSHLAVDAVYFTNKLLPAIIPGD